MEIIVAVILFCLPTIVLSWILPEKIQLLPCVLITFIFLGMYSPDSLVVLSMTTAGSYYLLKKKSFIKAGTLMVIFGCMIFFLFFKLGLAKEHIPFVKKIVPIGLSYYLFRQIHYAIEVYKGTLKKHSFLDYVTYLFFLPTLIIGPINLFQNFRKDMQRRRWDSNLMSEGLERILYGFAKVIILGNFFFTSWCVEFIYKQTDPDTWLRTYLQAFRFAGNAYVQFAGFSDIAIGLSLLFGFRIIENFNYPFLAKNIADFWTRWHISLSEWCKNYVFIPLFAYFRSPYLAVFGSMLVLSLWHEITINYLLWGMIHAVAINIWHRYNHSAMQKQLHRWIGAFHKPLGMLINLHFVVFSFIFLMEKEMADVFNHFKTLLFIHV